MAYSSVRVQFEIGHEASVRTKKTPDGFTHDWEVFVKGADNTDIQFFVEKVVFHLHETFPKPRRVIKEPPYVVKESGYAGFVLPIDVYLKNKEDPKKISFHYDLTLQNSGPPISRVLREPRVFQNPSEDFRRKLIRGGGVGVDTPNEVQTEDHKGSSGLSKSKPTESPSRKYKPELKLNDSFAEVFGTPIRKVTPEPKKVSELNRKITDSEKDKKKPSKPHEKEIMKDRERDRAKDRDRSKDKGPKPPQIIKSKEEHKKHEEKERKKDDYDEKKKRKEEREKKEKHKENKDIEKQPEKDLLRKEKKESRESDYPKKLSISKSHENKVSSEKVNVDGQEKDRSEKEKHKHRHKKKEKEKNRDKEKYKKEKERNDRDSKERSKDKEKANRKRREEVKEREERIRKRSRTPSPAPEKIKKGPLDALLVELGSSDSASPLSEDDDSIPSFKLSSKTPAKPVPEIKSQSIVNMSPKIKSTNVALENKPEKEGKLEEASPGKSRRDKSPVKKNKKFELESEKRKGKELKRRSSSSDREKVEEETEKPRKDREELEIDKEPNEKEEEKPKTSKKDKDTNRKRKRDKGNEQSVKLKKEPEVDVQVAAPPETAESVEENRKAEKFTKEYVAQLRDLQHRIMTLEDNDDLQKVVEVIAETGQYEITKKTFDFDLCALDSDTVRRLQEFFTPT